MTQDDPYFDQIEAYLEKQLAESEVTAFEQEAKQNKELAKALASHRDARKVLAADRRSTLTREFREAEGDIGMQEEAPARTFLNWGPYLAAAAGLLLLITWAIFFRPASGIDPGMIASREFEVYPATGTLMGQGQTQEADAFAKGITAYDDRDYLEAILNLGKVGTDDPKFIPARLYLGNSHLALVEPEPAITALEAVKATTDRTYRDPIQWYLALAYLSKGETSLGKEILESLALHSGDIYGEKAQAILLELE